MNTPTHIAHILSRGVDKRKIFLDKQDYLRFIHDLFEFNDANPANNVSYRFDPHVNRVAPQHPKQQGRAPRKMLVHLLAFCLMPNHYHLLLAPLVTGGISTFMRKLNVGYAKYFNQKYERKGALFEGRYKSVLVKSESHLLHLPYYIHLNPLDLASPEWRQRKLNDSERALAFLDQYRWSSFLDYSGKENFPSVTQRNFLTELLGDPENFRRNITAWLKEIDLASIKSSTLE